MPDDASGGREWIVEPPPGPGEVSLFLAGGDGVALTEAQEVALSELLATLETADVVGFTKNDCYQCWPLTCGKVTCSMLYCHLNQVKAASSGQWNLMGSFGTRTR